MHPRHARRSLSPLHLLEASSTFLFWGWTSSVVVFQQLLASLFLIYYAFVQTQFQSIQSPGQNPKVKRESSLSRNTYLALANILKQNPSS